MVFVFELTTSSQTPDEPLYVPLTTHFKPFFKLESAIGFPAFIIFCIVRVELVYGREGKWLITVLLRFSLLALLISLVTVFECFIAARALCTVALNEDATLFIIGAILPLSFAT